MTNEGLMVTVCMTTYNHESYIRQAIEGVVNQKTDFSFELLVSEDCSTDNTRNICLEYAEQYPEIIRLRLPEKNEGSLVNFHNTFRESTGKYIAICEGDDYWTDHLKLQKQVDFLEANPDYGLIYTRAVRYYQRQDKFSRPFGGYDPTNFENLLRFNTIPTLSVVGRRNLFLEYEREIIPQSQEWLMGDYPIWLWISHRTKIHYLPEVTAVYRILQESVSHSHKKEKVLRFQINGREIARYFAHRYSIMQKEVDIKLLWIRLELAVICRDRQSLETIGQEVSRIRMDGNSLRLTVLRFGVRCPYLFLLLLKFYRNIKSTTRSSL